MSRKFVYTKTKPGTGAHDLLTLYEDGRNVDCFSSSKLEHLTRLAADWMLGDPLQTIVRRWSDGLYHQASFAHRQYGKAHRQKIMKRALTGREE